MTEAELVAVIRGITPVIRDLIDVRVKALEALPPPRDGRDGLPGRDGPMGPAGENGRDGLNGKDGADGRDGKDGSPGLTYRGIFASGTVYAKGDIVTWNGSAWHCVDGTTSKPGDGAPGWTLMVKHGRDAK